MYVRDYEDEMDKQTLVHEKSEQEKSVDSSSWHRLLLCCMGTNRSSNNRRKEVLKELKTEHNNNHFTYQFTLNLIFMNLCCLKSA